VYHLRILDPAMRVHGHGTQRHRRSPTTNMPSHVLIPAPHPGGGASRLLLVGVAVAAAALAACTPTRWERNGVVLDYAGADWSSCRSQSIAVANRWYFEPFPQTFMGRDARGRPFSYYRASPYPSRFMLEQDYLDYCLRAHGYQRAPDKPADPSAPAPGSR
jgi:hypothetical protein